MATDDELPLKKKPVHEIGENLAMLSIEELCGRITVLKDEIARLEAAVASKQASRASADLFFKR
jgi:uncharacterized small protein (DUF1192 family)